VTATLDPPDSDLLTISASPSPAGATHVVVVGEVDSSSAPQLRAELDRLLDDGVPEIVVDLDGVTFLDSAGLCVLAAVHRRAGGQGARLRVLASGRAVIRPLQITGLFDLLAVEKIAPGAGVRI